MAAEARKSVEISDEMASNSHSTMEIEDMLRRANLNYKPRGLQEEILRSCLTGDTLAILPTNSGKTSLIRWLAYNSQSSCVIVVSPLTAILSELAAKLDSIVWIDGSEIRIDSDVRFIIGQPEQLTSATMTGYLSNHPELAAKITHIVVDECHCVLSWGKSGFRPDFLSIPSLKAFLNSGTKKTRTLALTATAAVPAQEEIKRYLGMLDCKVISESPDRPNVYLSVRSRPSSHGASEDLPGDSVQRVLDPYLKELAEMGSSCPKRIIYMPLHWMGYIHKLALEDYLSGNTEEVTVQPAASGPITSLVQQYHAPQTQEMKERISLSMLDEKSKLRLLLATEAYSMGADPPNVREVIHVGTPSTLETFMQEIGRCARDVKPGVAIAYVNATDLAGKHIRPEMREYLTTNECRRQTLLKHFGFDSKVTDTSKCCDNCSKSINETGARLAPPSLVSSPKDLIAKVAVCLRQYVDQINGTIDHPLPDGLTGLSASLVKEVSENFTYYSDLRNLSAEFPDINLEYLKNIPQIIEEIME